jgi:alanine dehydrogenase
VIADLLTREAAFDAVEKVFACHGLGRRLELPGGARGHRPCRCALRLQGRLRPVGGVLGLKAGGYWPHNRRRGIINHQSTVFLFDPDTGR